ncbi:MBL fold metallo-hydrolase [Sciscionella marina]|uniref:MBL fold metallo-hydrolase n=1 Tax=Sciscionella marina TaxID=508770 RepID=UPI00038117FC|nr:MBL fold metallo-hydrolase [Sciscionella marina]
MGTLRGAAGEFATGLTEPADGVYAWLQPNGSWGETNAGAVRGDGEALVVDTLWDLDQARRFLGALTEQLDGTPITAAVNTHEDGDHWWGNAALPGSATVYATEAAIEAMAGDDPARMARLDRLAELGARLPGAAGRLGGYVHGMLGPFEHAVVRTRLPDSPFTGALEVSVGGRPVRFIDLGPAHTRSDVVVHVPDADLVFCGDLLFIGVAPVCWHGPVTGWISALDRLLALGARTHVPGHGPPCGPGRVRELRDYFCWLVEAGGRAFAAGADVRTAARRLLDDRGNAAFAHWHDQERLAITLETVRRDYLGLGPPSREPAALARLLGTCAALR